MASPMLAKRETTPQTKGQRLSNQGKEINTLNI